MGMVGCDVLLKEGGLYLIFWMVSFNSQSGSEIIMGSSILFVACVWKSPIKLRDAAQDHTDKP